MSTKPKFFGTEVQWYFGVVEENDDTTAKDGHKLGRCRVRLLGIHSEEKIPDDSSGEGIPVDKLLWGYPIVPPIYSSMNGIGVSPGTKIMKGSWVMCASFDGLASQEVFIFGTIGGIPKERLNPDNQGFCDPDDIYPKDDFMGEEDTNRLARAEKLDETCVKIKNDDRDLKIDEAFESDWNQPESYYKAKYPFNQVFESEHDETDHGHVMEIDDTEGEERLHWWHKSNSFTEIDKDGNRSVKMQGDDYEIIVKDKHVYVKGDVTITVDGDAKMLIKGDAKTEVKGDTDLLVHGNTNAEIKGNTDLLVHGNANAEIMGNTDLLVGGNANAEVVGDVSLIVGGDVTATVAGDVTETIAGTCTTTALQGINLTALANVSLTAAEDITIISSGAIAIAAPLVTLAGVVLINGIEQFEE